ncbi:MAG: BACON domain-containing protein [Bacteroidales bacterium]|nr:BACON domain-containing protein [Bacteroidales bacterium]
MLAFLGIATACQNKPEDLGPAGIKVDQTELTFTSAAGTQTVTLLATRDWTVSSDAEWVICTPSEGEASKENKKIEVSVLANPNYDRTTTLVFSIGLADQIVTVKQSGDLGEKKALSVSEFNATDADETTVYEVQGVVTGSINTQYGNFYLTDGKEQMQVYGTTNWADYSDKLAVGDTVIAKGAHTLFNTTHEIKNAEIIYYAKGQGGNVNPGPTDAIYYNNFDKSVAEKTYGSGSSYPYLDQSDCWQNATGSGAANVTYDYKAMSARSNSNSDSNYSDYAGSGANNLFFGASAHFAVKGITLGGAKNLTVSFGSERYVNGADNTFNPSEFHVYVSEDDKKWVELSYSFPNGLKDGRWDMASSTFTVPASTSKLSIYISTDIASAYRLDDLTLVAASAAGTAIDFSKGIDIDAGGSTGGGDNPGGGDSAEAKAVTVADFIAAAESSTQPYKLTGIVGGSINATYGNFDLTDATGTVYVYGLTKTNLGYGATNDKSYASLGINAGDEVTLIGFRGSYNDKIEVMYAYYVSHKPAGGSGDNPGGGENPGGGDTAEAKTVTVADFIAAAESSTQPYKLTGVIGGSINTTYGNFDLTDATGTVYVYGLTKTNLGYGATNDKSYASLGLKAGDEVTLIGYRGSYGDKVEVLSAYYVSHKPAAGGDNPGGENPPAGDAGEYASNVTWTLGANAYDATSSGTSAQSATVNGVAVSNLLKLGKSSAAGTATITLPKGTSKVSFYGLSWAGKEATLSISMGSTEVMSQPLAVNSGVTGNAPYTITVSASDKYTKSFDAPLAADTQITVTTTGTNYRVILFGIKAE